MSTTNEKDFIFIRLNEDQVCGIFCQVCNFLIRTGDDAHTFDEWQSCHDCYLRFIEARKDEWIAGWRPEKEDVDKLYSEKSRIFIK